MAGEKLPPLEVFDARIVQAPLQGLLRNMDCELVRLLKQSMASHDIEAERKLSLFLTMLRFTKKLLRSRELSLLGRRRHPKT